MSDGSTGAITASSAAAAEAGAAILQAGGNAVDAAVATALASCVADPCNTGLGGYGGHMVYAPPAGDPVCIDFNMWLPADSGGALWPATQSGPKASVVPNVVAGLGRALAEYGSMAWADVVAPALALAGDGVSTNVMTRAAFAEIAGADFLEDCFELETDAGGVSRFRQPFLARTLDTLAAEGPGWFHDGPLARQACAMLGISPDLWGQAPQAVTVAAAARYRIGGVTLFSAPLGTSGSACMFATLAAGMDLAGDEAPDAVLTWARRLARVWTYRFGTPHGNEIEDAAAWIERALGFDQHLAIPAGPGHTCHLNAADRAGGMVAATLTHGPFWFGGRWTVPGSGVVMNAGMHLLSVPPKVTGERAYAVTNMSPTIANTADGARIACGCPGARRIPTVVGIVLARHLFGGRRLQEAVSSGRFHAEAADLATLEAGRWDDKTKVTLQSQFARVGTEGPADYFGPFTAIRRNTDGSIETGLDDRWPGFALRLNEADRM